MRFNSIEYFVFLSAVVLAYFTVPHRWRVWLLLTGSYLFYLWWRWEYGLLLLVITMVSYLGGLGLTRTTSRRRRQVWLACIITLSLAPLLFFKYFNLVNDSLRTLFAYSGSDYGIPSLELALPVGISFYTFRALGYSIDVFRGKYPAEKHWGRFALYVSFFPELAAGPIERADRLLGQFERQNHFDVHRLVEGTKLIVWGLFQKIVIADNLAIYVNSVYDHPGSYSGSTLLLATYFFAFQIYCDFSGYSDIAIGSARILGYDLMQNFRLPYLAESIKDFWRRWHISLSSWFGDYVYLSLGGNRVPVPRWVLNIGLVFLLSGLWHGASWTFAVWGGLHACYYLLEALMDRIKAPYGKLLPDRIGRWLRILVTFHLVVLAWVFFRARTISEAFLIVGKIATDLVKQPYRGSSQLETLVSVILILVLIAVQLLQSRGVLVLGQGRPVLPRFIRWPGYMATLYGLALLGRGSHEFIYLQF